MLNGAPVERDLDVVVICEINVDIVVTGLEGPPKFGAELQVGNVVLAAGSSGVLTATGLAALGLRVGVCGMVGDDVFGRYMLGHFDRWGIDRTGVVVRDSVATGASVILTNPDDRAILTNPGAMAVFTGGDLRQDLVRRARHAHFSSYFLQTGLQPELIELLRSLHSHGLTISADTGHDPAECWETDSLLDNVDLFMPNEVEALALTNQPTARGALAELAHRVPWVAIKCGGNGALAAHGEERLEAPGFSVAVVDTTGAGDAFDAGFLSGWLAGRDLRTCTRMGNACGALTAAHLGGSGAISPERMWSMIRTIELPPAQPA
jgi:sugar/nucleoside kinase (ribokinase family)